MLCQQCGKEMDKGAQFCKNCREKVSEKNRTHHSEQSTSPTMEKTADSEMLLFVRENQGYYERKWNRTSDNGVSWNFVALFFPFPWLGYRKMYKNALLFALAFLVLDIFLYFFVSNVVIDGILTIGLWLVLGAFGNLLYLQHVKRKLKKIRESKIDDTAHLINKQGGTSWLGILFASFIFIFVYALPATVLLPEAEEEDIPPVETKEAVTPIEWDNYENTRFGFIIKYPAEWNEEKEAYNQDGVTFSPMKDNKIMVFASIFDGIIDIPETGITEEIQTENGIPSIVNRTERNGKVIYEMSLLDGNIEYHLIASLTSAFAEENALVLREMIRHFEVTEGEVDTLTPMD